MSAAEALRAARAAGIKVTVEADGLLLEADAEPPQSILDALACSKPGIMALLRADVGWSAEDWQAFFDERAGMAEFEGGLSRPDAEAHAFNCCVDEWQNRNPVCSPPGLCARCGSGDQADDRLVPVGTASDAWLHLACWTAWRESRRNKAIESLRRMGISVSKERGG